MIQVHVGEQNGKACELGGMWWGSGTDQNASGDLLQLRVSAQSAPPCHWSPQQCEHRGVLEPVVKHFIFSLVLVQTSTVMLDIVMSVGDNLQEDE